MPLDPAALRVLADELLERGDQHGEFIFLQCEREARRGPVTPREEELCAAIEAKLVQQLEFESEWGRPSFGWRSGLLSWLHMEDSERLATQLQRLSEWQLGRYLRSFSILASVERSSYRQFVAQIDRTRFPEMREFSVEIGQTMLGRPRQDIELDIGNVQPLYAQWPQLEVLELHGNAHQLGEIRLPNLRRFAASYLQPTSIPSLVSAHWPKLEELDLVFAHTPAEADPVFGALLEAQMSPALQTVRIRSPWPEFFRAALPRSRLGRGRTVQVE
ncbi:MAG: hypothetical protein QM817_37465 [Archangium sp.]